MGFNDMLGVNGIFISDSARDQLNIELSEEQFNELKKTVTSKLNPDETKKCFITNTYCKVKDGLMLDPNWVADSLDKIIEKQDELYEKLMTEKIVICRKCGNSNDAFARNIICSVCETHIDLKKYEKSIKFPFTKRIAFRLYIKLLRSKK